MADNKVAEAYVEIGAKMDKLEKDLKKTEDKVEEGFAKAGKKAGNALESPIVSAALKATSAFGALELGVGATNAAVDALTGDIENAAEAVKRLPAGIGPFASQLENLLGKVTGLKAATEAWQRATETSLQVLSASMQDTERAIVDARDVYDQELDIMTQIARLRAKGLDDEDARLMRLEANAAAAQRTLDIERQIENLRQQNARQLATTGQEKSDRDDRIKNIKKELEGIDRAFRQNPLLEIEFLAGPKQEKAAALQTELSNLQKLNELRNSELQGRQRKIEQLEVLKQKITELDVLEDQQVTKDIQRLEDERIAEDIDARTEAQNRQQDAMNKAREEQRRLDEAADKKRKSEAERAAETLQREQEQQRREDVNLQKQIEATTARVSSVSNNRLLRPGDVGFGSKAGTAGFEKPQKIESKTLDQIKELLERNLAMGGGSFA